MLLEKPVDEILQAEMTEHLGAERGEQTDERQGYRNGSYERQLTTRIGPLTLEVPRDREGTFRTELFERYQRSEYVPTAVGEGTGDGSHADGDPGRFHTPGQETCR